VGDTSLVGGGRALTAASSRPILPPTVLPSIGGMLLWPPGDWSVTCVG
jgi:hypothetical protein